MVHEQDLAAGMRSATTAWSAEWTAGGGLYPYNWEYCIATMPSDARRRPRLAVVLHGKVGGVASLAPGAPPRATRSFENAQPSVAAAALCAASLARHVLAPNRAHFDVDVVGHSWSPEVGAALDALFAPVRSVHERGVPIAGFKCPLAGFSPAYCHRTVSHLLGIARAMELKRVEEEARGATYDAVFLSRWDVLWRTPLLDIRALHGWHPQRERRARTVWLPRICTPLLEAAGGNAGASFRAGVCGGMPSLWLASQAAVECHSQLARACQRDMAAEARELYVMDVRAHTPLRAASGREGRRADAAGRGRRRRAVDATVDALLRAVLTPRQPPARLIRAAPHRAVLLTLALTSVSSPHPPRPRHAAPASRAPSIQSRPPPLARSLPPSLRSGGCCSEPPPTPTPSPRASSAAALPSTAPACYRASRQIRVARWRWAMRGLARSCSGA